MLNQLRIYVKQRRLLFPKDLAQREIDSTATFDGLDRLAMGRYIYIGPECFISCKGGLSIGDGTIISTRVTILTSNHDYRSEKFIPYGPEDKHEPVVIGRGVWIGYGATVLPGVFIGDGAVLGAAAVVSNDVGPGQIVGGNPARHLSDRDDEALARCLSGEHYYLKRRMEILR